MIERLRFFWWRAAPAFGAALLLWAFRAIGSTFHTDYMLDLGSLGFPAPRELTFFFMWTLWGIPAALLLALSLARIRASSPGLRRSCAALDASADRTWIAFGVLSAALVPFAIRMLVLRDADLSTDESCYRFGAELVASGRLWVPSPPHKLFFDRSFMINDGHMYPMYFIGWPALMALGVKLGVGGYMNALYAAVTVPPVFFVARRLGGVWAARVALAIYLTSPTTMGLAATQMANTSCMMMLAWMTWAALRSRDANPAHWCDAAVTTLFGCAFLIRPTPALGIGAPLLVYWAFGLRARSRGRALAVAAATAGAALTAAIFFAVNKAQTGSFTTVAYAREFEYANENGLRFSDWGVFGIRNTVRVPHFEINRPLAGVVANAATALVRLNSNLFGWPTSFAFVPLAGLRKGARLPIAMTVTFFLVHAMVGDPGTDTIAPHHYVETAWPLMLLSALGVVAATERLASWMAADSGRVHPFVPGAVLLSMIFLGLTVYAPNRLRALGRIADDVLANEDALRATGISNAVVFSPARPWTAGGAFCSPKTPQHYVNWRINNDPDLKHDILWLNHVTVELDREVMEDYPGRSGFIMYFDPQTCARQIVPLATADPRTVPDGDVNGDNRGFVGLRAARP